MEEDDDERADGAQPEHHDPLDEGADQFIVVVLVPVPLHGGGRGDGAPGRIDGDRPAWAASTLSAMPNAVT